MVHLERSSRPDQLFLLTLLECTSQPEQSSGLVPSGKPLDSSYFTNFRGRRAGFQTRQIIPILHGLDLISPFAPDYDPLNRKQSS